MDGCELMEWVRNSCAFWWREIWVLSALNERVGFLGFAFMMGWWKLFDTEELCRGERERERAFYDCVWFSERLSDDRTFEM